VTGEAPLIDTTTSRVGGNIDPRQMQDLPINGRNWLDLAILAPGSRQNATSDTLGGRDYDAQINVDGQRVTQLFAGAFGQPRYSRESMAEVSGDQSLRRHAGAFERPAAERHHQVRHEYAAGHLLGLLPRRQAQREGLHRQPRAAVLEPAAGVDLWRSDHRDKFPSSGRAVRREPTTFTYETLYPAFNIDQPSTRAERGARTARHQVSPRNRLTFRVNSRWHCR
jgi:hypothetical protein